jgi:hypothetical protein
MSVEMVGVQRARISTLEAVKSNVNLFSLEGRVCGWATRRTRTEDLPQRLIIQGRRVPDTDQSDGLDAGPPLTLCDQFRDQRCLMH